MSAGCTKSCYIHDDHGQGIVDVPRPDWSEAIRRPTREIVADNVRLAIERIGGLDRAAAKMARAKSTLSRWQSGESEPSYADLDELARLDGGAHPAEFFLDANEQLVSPREVRVVDAETALRVLAAELKTGLRKPGKK